MITKQRDTDRGDTHFVFDDPRWEALATRTATPQVVAELRAWAAHSQEAREAWIAFQPLEPSWLDTVATGLSSDMSHRRQREPLLLDRGAMFIGRYRLTRQISNGHHTTIWGAEDTMTGKMIAIKLVSRDVNDVRGDEICLRLQRQGRVLKKVHHAGIVRILDVGAVDADTPFLVMEHLEGEDLGQALHAKRRLPLDLALRIGRELAEALEAIHEARIIHRNVSPSNVFLERKGLLDDDFAVKLIGFGFSKDLGQSDELTTDGRLEVGRGEYLSPEQITANDDIDARTDIWSLGLVLFEMITGTLPFHAAPADQLLAQLNKVPVPPPSSKVKGVPPSVDQIVKWCTERDRDKRLRSAAEVQRLLAAAEQEVLASVVVPYFGIRQASVSPRLNTPYRLPGIAEASSREPTATTTLRSESFDAAPNLPRRSPQVRRVLWALPAVLAAASLSGFFFVRWRHAERLIEEMSGELSSQREMIHHLEKQASMLEAEKKQMAQRLDAMQQEINRQKAALDEQKKRGESPKVEPVPPKRGLGTLFGQPREPAPSQKRIFPPKR